MVLSFFRRFFMRSMPRFTALCLSFMLALLPVSASAAPSDSDQRPLLLIRYNQEYVHFNRALRQAVANAEHLRPGVTYRVVSVVPQPRRGVAEVASATASERLKKVTAAMAELGVSNERIKTASEKSKAVSSQEIRVFVE
jgi:hypothetical protein